MQVGERWACEVRGDDGEVLGPAAEKGVYLLGAGLSFPSVIEGSEMAQASDWTSMITQYPIRADKRVGTSVEALQSFAGQPELFLGFHEEDPHTFSRPLDSSWCATDFGPGPATFSLPNHVHVAGLLDANGDGLEDVLGFAAGSWLVDGPLASGIHSCDGAGVSVADPTSWVVATEESFEVPWAAAPPQLEDLDGDGAAELLVQVRGSTGLPAGHGNFGIFLGGARPPAELDVSAPDLVLTGGDTPTAFGYCWIGPDLDGGGIKDIYCASVDGSTDIHLVEDTDLDGDLWSVLDCDADDNDPLVH